MSKLTLARLALSPPSLRRFASRRLLPVWLRWDVASLVLVWRFQDLIDWLIDWAMLMEGAIKGWLSSLKCWANILWRPQRQRAEPKVPKNLGLTRWDWLLLIRVAHPHSHPPTRVWRLCLAVLVLCCADFWLLMLSLIDMHDKKCVYMRIYMII